MPKYFDNLRFAVATLAEYEADYKTAKGRSAWMVGRRIGEYAEFVAQQAQGIHKVAVVIDGHETCLCGLISPDLDTQIQRAPGHLQGGQLTTLLIHDFDDGGGYELYCQVCRESWPLALDRRREIDLVATLAQHQTCPQQGVKND
ncbi:MAG: hypothetical protein ACKOWJ_00930 [Micrococcales bacterium]